VAGIEAYLTPNSATLLLAHADFERGVRRREVRTPERIDNVCDSEGEDIARANHHENFCGQDILRIFVGLLSLFSVDCPGSCGQKGVIALRGEV
jgi:hypothetical protein